MTYNSYQIAEIIGVNVSTIKRWTDSGKLQCHQSAGGHRKFHLYHLTEFLKQHKKTSTNINVNNLIGKNDNLTKAIDQEKYKYLVQYSYEKLISGDSEKIISLNNSLILKKYKLYDIFDKILNPTLIKIGEQWSKGNLTITEEHLASEIIKKFLTNINFQYMSINSKYNAFMFTLNNDKHDIPLHMSESIFNQHKGINTFNLGPDLPVEDFLKLAQKAIPHFIFISIIYIQDLDNINKQLNLLCEAFNNTETAIFIKGRVNELSLNYPFISIENYKELTLKISERLK